MAVWYIMVRLSLHPKCCSRPPTTGDSLKSLLPPSKHLRWKAPHCHNKAVAMLASLNKTLVVPPEHASPVAIALSSHNNPHIAKFLELLLSFAICTASVMAVSSRITTSRSDPTTSPTWNPPYKLPPTASVRPRSTSCPARYSTEMVQRCPLPWEWRPARMKVRVSGTPRLPPQTPPPQSPSSQSPTSQSPPSLTCSPKSPSSPNIELNKPKGAMARLAMRKRMEAIKIQDSDDKTR